MSLLHLFVSSWSICGVRLICFLLLTQYPAKKQAMPTGIIARSASKDKSFLFWLSLDAPVLPTTKPRQDINIRLWLIFDSQTIC